MLGVCGPPARTSTVLMLSLTLPSGLRVQQLGVARLKGHGAWGGAVSRS